jgi:hypothetical protein
MSPVRSIFFNESELAQYVNESELAQYVALGPKPTKVPNHIYTDDYGTYCVWAIIQFIQSHYSDALLAHVLADLPKMAIDSCSTLTAIVTAEHSLEGHGFYCKGRWHALSATAMPFGKRANEEYLDLGKYKGLGGESEYLRYRRLEPFLHEEMARRCRLRAAVPVEINKESM